MPGPVDNGSAFRSPVTDGEPAWEAIRAAFAPQYPMINLNNAAISPAPLVVQDAMIKAYRFANGEPDVNMWKSLDLALPETKRKLSILADCDVSEVAINRNATEGLCTAIFGIPIRSGDEVLVADWDYPSMRTAWGQRAKREGVVVRPVQYGLMDDDDVVVEAYTRAITPRTKVMHLTHMAHWTGRVLPIERLCALADELDIRTVVDAAQSFAHIPLSFRKMRCDYLATSLHKWLGAPFGTGMLIVKSSRIDETWPLFGTFEQEPHGIDKFDHWNLGTYCSPLENAIGTAIDFHNEIGTERMHARLRELSKYWVEQAADVTGLRIHTPMNSPNLAAVTLFSIEGLGVEAIEKRLSEEYKIHARLRRQFDLAGIRVSPHIYTRKSELDQFVSALRRIAQTA